jgi:hypothetical protein
MERDFPAAASSATDRPLILGQNFMSCSLYLRSSQGTMSSGAKRNHSPVEACQWLHFGQLRSPQWSISRGLTQNAVSLY